MSSGVGESPPGPRPPLVVVCGPTATGKTDLAVRLALAIRDGDIPAEVISADSRQVYRGMDVGTAKPTLAERRDVPHHGLDLVDPDQPFSVADFAAHAEVVLGDLATRGGVAILAGGTGLWIRAVADGLALDQLPHDPAVRAALDAELAAAGPGPLVARLRAIAPRRAAAVDLRNPRRVVRALEIASIRGDREPPAPRGYPGPVVRIGVDVADRALHRRWIEDRAVAQLDGGLLAEAQRLRSRYPETLPAFSGIGYREAFDLLDGHLDRAGYLAVNVHRNVTFARRQRTWFRPDARIRWLDPSADDPLPSALVLARSASAILG
ncbi:MAG: tRNA (adenosine(37)-N6)-dimethylallyltransferase MiaA [Chloroflexi bacterium]|nr:tRNA (adenosine(37)-N6)-dimethylallyltransferase MiaA [Chloroflexota bacterium]